MQHMFLLIVLFVLTGCQSILDKGCDTLPTQERDQCYYNQAIEQSDAELCRGILTIAQREECFMYLAKETCNVVLCDHVKVLYKTSECQQQIVNSTHCGADEPAPKEEPNMMDEENNLPPADDIILPGASNNSDDPCSVLGGDQRDFCYQKAAIDAGDASLCEKVVGERYVESDVNMAKNKCYFILAISQCSPSICDKVKGEQSPFTAISCKQRISQECP